MYYKASIVSILLFLFITGAAAQEQHEHVFDFYGDSIAFSYEAPVVALGPDSGLTRNAISNFIEALSCSDYKPILDALIHYRESQHPDDWVYYQLIRKTAQSIAPKASNYYKYTLYKCFLLARSGYSVALVPIGNKLLFFVHSKDDVYDIPTFTEDGRRYVCLNYHDYGFNVDLAGDKARSVMIPFPEATGAFSYQLSGMPAFRPGHYHVKELAFNHKGRDYHFKIEVNDEVKAMFVNYPVADYGLYLNNPLSSETYNSLIPQLQKAVKHMSATKGVDFLMHFTRDAFQYGEDEAQFGREKHLNPEQTLLYDTSDCEDRAALFYCLVKEIYKLPMVVIAFPHHVTVAVKLDKAIGRQVVYKGVSYSVCEPTPQAENLRLGALSPELGPATFEVAYCYQPGQ